MSERASPGAPLRFALLGVPSPLMVWMSVLLRNLVIEEVGQAFDGVVLDTDEATATFLAGGSGGNLFVISHFPRPDLIEWLSAEGIPTVIAVDDVVACVAHNMTGMLSGHFEAVRPVTQSLSLLQQTITLRLRAMVSSEHLDVVVGPFVQLLIRLAFRRPIDDLETKLERLGFDARHTIRQSIRSQPGFGGSESEAADLTADKVRSLRAICQPLIELVTGNTNVEIVWSSAYFYDGATYTLPAPMVMDMVGPARCLYYGPYLHLPPGRYDVVLTVGLSNEILNTILRAEIYLDRVVATFLATARKGGLYEMPFDIDIEDARQPIQIRLFIDQGEIEGRIAFAQASITPRFLAATVEGG